MADFYAARAGTNAGAPLDGFLTAVHVRLADTDPSAEPFVAFNLMSDERDLARMRDGVRLTHRLLTVPDVAAVSHGVFAGAYTRWLRALRSTGTVGDIALALGARLLDAGALPRRALMGLAFPRGGDIDRMVADDRLLDDWIRATVLGNWHACGTCRMGAPQDRSAVVDPAARVIGVDGQRVADASIMPTVPCANTNLSTIMIGEKVSDAILVAGK